jgi:hypothetical protein
VKWCAVEGLSTGINFLRKASATKIARPQEFKAERQPQLQPALHYELEQVSKTDILRRLKKGFGGKTIRDVRFRLG